VNPSTKRLSHNLSYFAARFAFIESLNLSVVLLVFAAGIPRFNGPVCRLQIGRLLNEVDVAALLTLSNECCVT